jgi:hypothetical protein
MFDKMLMFELPDAWHFLLHLSMARLPLFDCIGWRGSFVFDCGWMAWLLVQYIKRQQAAIKHKNTKPSHKTISSKV